MPGNTIGKLFQVTSFGESHGKLVGVTVDGCPAGIELTEADIQPALDRRRPGQSDVTTARNEADQCEIVTGTFEGKTTGMPISVLVYNKDQQSKDYEHLRNNFREGHADQTYSEKYGHRDHRGGGRSSGRETVSRVIAGAIAQKVLPQDVKIIGHTVQIGQIFAEAYDEAEIENNSMRCADAEAAKAMETHVLKLKEEHNSAGALIFLEVKNPPKSLGEPCFDKLKADLAKTVMSIGAVTGFSYGAGFYTSQLTGQEYTADPKNFGGILGGISTGEPITLEISVKPTSTVGKSAQEGRHDPCIAPRAIPVIEAMVAITLADHYLRHKAYQ